MSKKVIGFLTRKDPVLGRFIKKCEPISLAPNNRITLFEAQAKSVVYHQ